MNGLRIEFDCILKGHKGSVLCIDVEEAKGYLLSSSEDETVRLWNLKTKKCERCIVPDKSLFELSESSKLENYERANINSVSFWKDDFCLITIGGGLFCYKIFGNEEIIIKEHSFHLDLTVEEINGISLSKNKQFLLAYDDLGQVILVNVEKPKIVKKFKFHDAPCTAAKYKPGNSDYEDFVTGGLDFNIIFSNSNFEPKFDYSFVSTGVGGSMLVNPPYVHDLCFSEDGEYCMTALGDGSIRVVHLERRAEVGRLSFNHASQVIHISRVDFARGEKSHFLTVGNNKVIAIWSVIWPVEAHLERSRVLNKKLQEMTPDDRRCTKSSTIKKAMQINRQLKKLRVNVISKLEAAVSHNEKINWVVSTRDGKLYVADVSNDILVCRIQRVSMTREK